MKDHQCRWYLKQRDELRLPRECVQRSVLWIENWGITTFRRKEVQAAEKEKPVKQEGDGEVWGPKS